ncbi:MAG TPA: phosphomannomutase/phosphoglucomutase [Myxococcota bacterium]|nr:phosphomannomutase/phosphoglucomutase [Myxococcota bacterium]
MKVSAEIFREYDIRGIVDKELTRDLARHLGAAIGTYVRRGGGKRVVVGADCRESGKWLGEAMVQGLVQTGCEAIHVGVVPTPVGYWAIQHLKADGGVQITGSHNPPEYNGFKITLLGRSLHGQDIQQLRKLIETEDYEKGAGKSATNPILDNYIDELSKTLRPAKRKLKVVVDAGNGTGGITSVPLYEKLGYEVIPIFCEMDGTFPNHHPDPTVEENLEDLKREVAKHKADLGLSFDGDADRVGVINGKGEVIWGDKVMILLARSVLKESPGASIIGEVKCSKTLYDDITKHGGKAIMWRTGHSLIKSKMKEEKAELAGEMSGHIFFKHRYYGFDDGVYAGGRLLEILSESAKSIDEHLADVPKTVSTPEIRFDCPEAIKFALVKKAVEFFRQGAKAGGYNVIDIDGARVEWSDGWGLVRPSNTQPILVLRFEAQSDKRLQEIRQLFDREITRLKKELSA